MKKQETKPNTPKPADRDKRARRGEVRRPGDAKAPDGISGNWGGK